MFLYAEGDVFGDIKRNQIGLSLLVGSSLRSIPRLRINVELIYIQWFQLHNSLLYILKPKVETNQELNILQSTHDCNFLSVFLTWDL